MGRLVLVVGPSGAGKDTLINKAKESLAGDPRFHFVRRVVTRSADTSLEDHDTMSTSAFEAARRNGAFALHWDAHGLSYGIPAGIDQEIAAGRTVIANGSRRIAEDVMALYPDAQIVLVDAPRDVRASRLAGRGRESLEEVSSRLAREAQMPVGLKVTRIDNSADLQAAVTEFIAVLHATI